MVFIEYYDRKLISKIGKDFKHIRTALSEKFNPSIGESISLEIDLKVDENPFHIICARVTDKHISYDKNGEIEYAAYSLKAND